HWRLQRGQRGKRADPAELLRMVAPPGADVAEDVLSGEPDRGHDRGGDRRMPVRVAGDLEHRLAHKAVGVAGRVRDRVAAHRPGYGQGEESHPSELRDATILTRFLQLQPSAAFSFARFKLITVRYVAPFLRFAVLMPS